MVYHLNSLHKKWCSSSSKSTLHNMLNIDYTEPKGSHLEKIIAKVNK